MSEERDIKVVDNISPHGKEKRIGRRKWEPARSWISLVGVFGNNILCVLPQSGYGLWYDHLVDKYDTSRANVGMSYFIFSAVMVLLVFIDPLARRYGVKKVSIIAACICTSGYISCAFASQIWMFNILFGILAGSGRVVVFPMVEVQQLFNHNRGLATGLACIGFNVGDIISPVLSSLLLSEYGISGTLLIHSAIQAHSILFGLLYVPDANKKVIMKEMPKMEKFEEEQQPFVEQKNTNTNTAPKKRFIIAIKNLRKLCDFSVFRNCICVLMFSMRAMWLTSKFIANTHLASACVHYGLSEQQSAYVVSVFGLSSLVTMVLTTVVLNVKCVRREVYLCVGASLLVVSAACAMAGTLYSPMMFFSATLFLGVGDAMSYASFMLVIVQLVGTDKFQNMMLVIEGVTPLLAQAMAAPFCGWLVDITNEYWSVFLVATVAAAVCFIHSVILVIYIWRKPGSIAETLDIKVTVELPEQDSSSNGFNQSSKML